MLPDAHVVIPVYNNEDFIAQSIESLKNQTYGKKIKFIFHDDGSTDRTVQAIADLTNGDSRFIINRSDDNEGNSHARIHAVNLSQKINPHAAFLFVDADDTIHPEHVECAMHQMDKTKADVCLLNCAVVAATPELQGKADQLRQKLRRSDEVVNYITDRPDELVNISNYPQLLEFNHYSVSKAYSGRVKKNWLHPNTVRTKPDIALMAVLGDTHYNVTALDSGYKSYTYNIRKGSVSDYSNRSKTKLANSSSDLLEQLYGFMGNMSWGVPYPDVGKAAEAFVNRHIEEQTELFNQVPLLTRLFTVNNVYQKFKHDAATVKATARLLSTMSTH